MPFPSPLNHILYPNENKNSETTQISDMHTHNPLYTVLSANKTPAHKQAPPSPKDISKVFEFENFNITSFRPANKFFRETFKIIIVITRGRLAYKPFLELRSRIF